jgi:hypothetical protein
VPCDGPVPQRVLQQQLGTDPEEVQANASTIMRELHGVCTHRA